MSKETMRAVQCACGQAFAFPEQHWPHCKYNPANLNKTAVGKKVLAKSGFTKSELAQIATHGPVRDEKFRTRRTNKGAKR